MEVFICTLHSGTRGKHDQGDAQKTKNNLKLKQNKFNSIYNLSQNSKLKTQNYFWVGGLIGLLMLIGLFLPTSKVHAADSLSNVELAKKVINEVAPIVSEKNQSVSARPVSPKASQGGPSLDGPDIATASLALTANDYIQKPLVVETQITAEAPKQKLSKKSLGNSNNTGGVHYFPYGYCTYYVSQKRTVTWSGNAGTWLKGAKSAGLKTSDEPQVGAIMVTSEGGRTGHVAYVEKVNGDQVTISEMNFRGYGIISSRTIAISSRFIKGYIY